MLRLAKEHFECLLEQVDDFYSDCKDYHGHDERPEHLLLLAPVLAFNILYQFRTLNEYLLEMKRVHRKRIDVSENAPVSQVAYQANQLSRIFPLNFLESCLDISIGQRRRARDKQIRLDVLISSEVIIFLPFLFVDHFKISMLLSRSIPLFKRAELAYLCITLDTLQLFLRLLRRIDHARLNIRRLFLLWRLLWPSVKMNDVVNLSLIRFVRNQSHWKLTRVVQHILHNLLFHDLDRVGYVFQVLFLSIKMA